LVCVLCGKEEKAFLAFRILQKDVKGFSANYCWRCLYLKLKGMAEQFRIKSKEKVDKNE